MKMWSVDVIFLLLFCYACVSTGNGRVYFVSINFNNTLHWDPVKSKSSEEKFLYSVQYWSDAEKQFQRKEECQNIKALSCDLTAETPAVPDVHYIAWVHANGRMLGRTVTRFKPIADTNLSAPILSNYTTASSLHVNVTLPLGPNGVSVAEIIGNSKNGPSKAVMVYTLKISEPKWAALVNETKTGQFVINLKNNQTTYCGHVAYKPYAEWGRAGSEPATFCVTLPDSPPMLVPWLLTISALLVAVVTVSIVWMCNYVKGGKKTNVPLFLVNTSGAACHVLQPPDSHIIISAAAINPPAGETMYSTIQVKPRPLALNPGGYSPQDTPCPAWQDSSGSSVGLGDQGPPWRPVDVSGQSSEIYSAVAVHVPTEDEETRTLTLPLSAPCDKGDNQGWRLTPHGVTQSAEPDVRENNPAKPLLLHTVRDTDGQLVLPSLSLQVKSDTGAALSPLQPESKPLLSDLMESRKEAQKLAWSQSLDSSEWSDDGSDVNAPTQHQPHSSYLPAHPAAPGGHQQCGDAQMSESKSESGYNKQDWMPAIFEQGCGYGWPNRPWNWTGPKEEEEEEELKEEGDIDSGEERPTQIRLGNWLVQIQE